ncbi:Cell division protein FtsH [Sandaracinus amylolyticus]|uniref:Cell division protein FtsH n=1 Tax=Sandaracinus amylolyticus TaxID=927083 RepID=A0A0F6W919_9BACT|nr:Cell division protein FtsH [Sandaracinus amylolyticus]
MRHEGPSATRAWGASGRASCYLRRPVSTAQLDALEKALAASPDNLALRAIVVETLLAAGEARRAARHLDVVDPSAVLEPAQRILAIDAYLRAESPTRALAFATGDRPEITIRRARALLALDRRDEALVAYRAALAANPTLEDKELAAALEAKVREVSRPGGPKLRVIANDATDDADVVRMLQPAREKVTLRDVGGHDEVKRQIEKKIILPFQKPTIFQRFKKRVGGGILLYGPPGCGKTLLARATAGECDATFFDVAISDILDMYIGESERKLHAIFEKARSSTPAVLFFDELEALAGKRQYSREMHASKIVSQFLAEMDGFAQNNGGVLVLGATNVPWAIDPAFRRPGRFDRVLFVPPPDRGARAAILEILLRDKPTDDAIDVGAIAARTSGLSGADLGHLVENATDAAIEESLERGAEVPITQAHLVRALGETRATTSEWLTTARNYARYANEAGQYDEVLAFLDRHGKG